MKQFLLLVSFSVWSLTTIQAQCQPLNGSFEDWTDYTDSFEYELGLELTVPVILPTGWLSLIRLLDIALSDFIIDYLDTDTLDLPIFENIRRYTPGADGTASAVRISGDTLSAVSDLLQITSCGGRPDKLNGFIKYEGSGVDTLTIIAILHGSDLLDTSNAIGYAQFQSIGGDSDISRDGAEFNPFSVDFTYNSDQNADSVSILIFTTKDLNNLEDTSFFVVDEIKFDGGSVPTQDFRHEAVDALVPNPASDRIRLNLETIPGGTLEIFNAVGVSVLQTSVISNQFISVSHLPTGTYMARIYSEGHFYWQKLFIGQ